MHISNHKSLIFLLTILIVCITLSVLLFNYRGKRDIRQQLNISTSTSYKSRSTKNNNQVSNSALINDSLENLEFPQLPKPQPGDWLDQHDEQGQTLKEFITQEHNWPDKKRNLIYIQPLETFKGNRGPSLEMLKNYTSIYFGLPVKVLSVSRIDTTKFTSRINPSSNKKQYLASDILKYLIDNVPSDAFCVIGITLTDLYPEPSWNFVFGYASFTERVGVFSFARYVPGFYNIVKPSYTIENKILFILRCSKVISHEIGHMFGMLHCIAYHCNMNGSNNLGESDAQPIHLCPVCLLKLQRSVGFNIVSRYENLSHFYKDVGLKKENEWVKRRIRKIKTKEQR